MTSVDVHFTLDALSKLMSLPLNAGLASVREEPNGIVCFRIMVEGPVNFPAPELYGIGDPLKVASVGDFIRRATAEAQAAGET
jgi:hypothetical protein